MHRMAPCALAVAVLLGARPAPAETRAIAPSGGGLPPLEVKVDLAAAVVDANGTRIPIPLDRFQLPSEQQVVLEPIAIGEGRHVVHVRIPAKDSAVEIAWEAILAAGKAAPIFAGLTGLVSGDPGERTGKAVQIIENGATRFVLVGDVREDLRICGQSLTLLDPLALYPAPLELRPATVQRLSAASRANAQAIVAADNATEPNPPLAKLLVARGSSVPGSRGAELTDRDVHTAWSEKRPGVGQGEFVVMAAPKDVPIAKMQVVVAPIGATPASGAAPKTFYLVTSTQTFEVTLPEDAWLNPGKSYEIAFPQPIEASCVALVLDSAQTRNLAHPDVSIAELVAYSEFDAKGATLDDVAKKLSSERGIAAAQVLERAGEGALAAVQGAYEGLDVRGRALAIDVAAAHELCAEAAPLLARGLCDKGEAARKAHEKLERCKGAAPVLAKSLRENASTRACVAPTLAAIAPQEALDPIADAMASTPQGEGQTRATLRRAFAEALKEVGQGRLAALVGDSRRSATARLEILRAAEARVSEAPVESQTTLDELLRGSPPLRTRYLVLGPLEELARAGDRAAAARIVEAIAHDPEWPVRARAAEAGAGVADAQAALVSAAGDSEPRVREAALKSLAAAASPRAIQAAKALIGQDGWPFVRAQAVLVLSMAPASGDVDGALAGVLHDGSAGIRGGALAALARHRAGAYGKAIRERLDDQGEDAEVRAAAAYALGAVCDAGSEDRLTQLARGLGVPGAGEPQQQVGLGAIAGLAALQPADLRDRLAPLLAPPSPSYARAAAQRALSTRGACH
jgi:HEAT repeat protein